MSAVELHFSAEFVEGFKGGTAKCTTLLQCEDMKVFSAINCQNAETAWCLHPNSQTMRVKRHTGCTGKNNETALRSSDPLTAKHSDTTQRCAIECHTV